MTYITGQDVSTEHILRLADQLALTPWPSAEQPQLSGMTHKTPLPDDLVVVTSHLTESNIQALLQKSVSYIIDAAALDESIQNFLGYAREHSLDRAIGVLLTCPVIYACDVAKIFTEALDHYLNFSRNRYEGIHLALHESMVNGLIHGNLQLSSNLRQSARDFIEYARLLDERLNDPAYAQKSMGVWATWDMEKLEIKIRDEGAGYSAMPIMSAQPTLRSKSGRGLRIIAGTADSCTIDDFGREITLSFLRGEREMYPVSGDAGDELVSEQRLHAPDLSQCRVLVIEDNKSNQAVLSRLLNVIGIVNIEMAADGIEGLQKVPTYRPDLIILDLTMPRMNGYEVLYHLKSAPETRSIPVLVQTVSDTRETREKTVSSGATDFISKPLNPLEFFARVKVHLENTLLVRHLEGELSRIETELHAAQRMQVGMLPDSDHVDEVRTMFHVDIAQYFSPSSALGGDFWQMFPIRGKLLGFYMCDFSGHGVAAALNTFRLHAIIAQTDKKKIVSPAAFLKNINTQLYDLLPRGQFATFFFGIYDREAGVLTYASAGSPPPMIKSGRKVSFLDTAGMPLGIMKNPGYSDKVLPVRSGDMLFLFSDALTESPNKAGERLGNAGLKKLIMPHLKKENAYVSLMDIMHDFFTFAPPPPPDDVTAVLMRFDPES